MPRAFRIVDDLYPTVVGGGVSIYSTVLRAHQRWISDDVWTLQSHMTLKNDAPVEGVDFPFYYARGIWEENYWLRARRRKLWTKFLDCTNDDLSVPLVISLIPPDTGLIQFERGYDSRPAAYLKKEKQWKQHRLRYTVQEGLMAPVIPATTYQTDSCRLLSEIQFHLLESTIDGGLTWSLWTTEEVLGYLNERLSRFLVETGITQSMTTFTTFPGQAVYDLPTDLIDLTRLSIDSVLTKTTKWEMDHSIPGWQLAATGTPDRYMQWPEESLTVRFYPPPATVSTVRVIYIADYQTITTTCVPLPIPAAFAPAIKYGVMADMLTKQGEANDPQRAGYCEERFQEGIDLAKALLGVFSEQ